jgi:hypothetical protein
VTQLLLLLFLCFEKCFVAQRKFCCEHLCALRDVLLHLVHIIADNFQEKIILILNQNINSQFDGFNGLSSLTRAGMRVFTIGSVKQLCLRSGGDRWGRATLRCVFAAMDLSCLQPSQP